MLKKIFGIERFGWVELIVVLNPIFSAYRYGFPLGTIILFILAIFLSLRSIKFEYNRIILLTAVYFYIHELILALLLPDVQSSFYNFTIERLLFFFLILLIAPHLDFEKFYGALVMVSIICIAGLFYHVFQVYVLNQNISTITLPFMPSLAQDSTIWDLGNRPKSFFMEPAAYATFMFIPLSLSLIKQRYLFAALIIVSVLASTSSNGFFQVGVIVFVYLISNKRNKGLKRIIIIGLFAGLTIFSLRSSLFEAGRAKINETDFEDNVRVTAGLNLYSNLGIEDKIIGIKQASIIDYVLENTDLTVDYEIEIKGYSIFIPAFWWYMIKLGLIGGILYLLMFTQFIIISDARPYAITCIVGSFVQSLSMVLPLIVLIMLKHRAANLAALENCRGN